MPGQGRPGRNAALLKGVEMSKQAMREETERLIREAMAKKTITIKQGADPDRGHMRKVRREKPRVRADGRIPCGIHLQGMRAQAKNVVTPDARDTP